MLLNSDTTRRHFLATAAGAAGVAAAVGPVGLVLATPAGAQNLDGPDAEVASALEGAELAAAAFYDQAVEVAPEDLDAGLAAVMVEFGRHHRGHAGALRGLIGPGAPGVADQDVLDRYAAPLRSGVALERLLGLAVGIENTLVSSHLAAIGTVVSDDVAAMSASILPVQAQHVVVLGQAAGLDLDAYMPSFETITGAVDVAPEGQ